MRTFKKGVFILLFGIYSYQVSGQQQNKELDFIVVIDEKVWVTNTYFQIIINKTTGLETIKASYYPGNLSIKQSDYDQLICGETKSIYLQFVYYQYVGKKQKVYNYEIELKKPWLQDYFNILHIYNLNNKKYRKLPPIREGENYTYELDSPNHTFRPARNK